MKEYILTIFITGSHGICPIVVPDFTSPVSEQQERNVYRPFV
jgi:hypothetical protein